MDQTTQTRPHKHIETTDENFRLLVESVKDYGIFMLDPQGNIATWNIGAERMKGYSAKEVIGQNFSLFYTDEDRARRHPQYELAIAVKMGRYEEEGWRVRKDGGKFWANVTITHLINAKGISIGFSKVTRDLSERKNAEDALRISEERARLMYEGVKDYAFITLDNSGIVTGWNEGAKRIKGYEAQEIIGKHFSVFYDEIDLGIGKCEYELSEAEITGRYEDEGLRVRKDGTKFWANVVITALYDKNRQLRGFSKVTQDVTIRKRYEDRLKMLNESLERRVQERTIALSETNKSLEKEILERNSVEVQLQQAIQIRDEFLSIASHELRTPLTPLKLQLQGLIHLIRKGALSSLNEERVHKVATSIERSLHRMTKLIDGLLDVARINAGKIELNPERINVTEVINEVVHNFQSINPIKIDAPAELITYIDHTRLEQVLSNLIVNAVKFGESKPIEVNLCVVDQKMIIKVKDSGIGISPEDLPKIFNRFEQVSKRISSSGLGLGLYISKQIVDALKGTIRAESNIGIGSVFIIELPFKDSEHGQP